MTLFEFLKALQLALTSGLFVRDPEYREVRIRPTSDAAQEALYANVGQPVSRHTTLYCPLTCVALFLGYDSISVGDYHLAGKVLGIDPDVQEAIVSAADTMFTPQQLTEEQAFITGEWRGRERLTLEAATTPVPVRRIP